MGLITEDELREVELTTKHRRQEIVKIKREINNTETQTQTSKLDMETGLTSQRRAKGQNTEMRLGENGQERSLAA